MIFCSDEALLNLMVSWVAQIPKLGPMMEAPVKDFLAKQKEKLHTRGAQGGGDVRFTQAILGILKLKPFFFQNPSIISWIFEKFVLAMVVYFLVSIVNSLAQSYHKRINKRTAETSKKD